MAKIEHIIEALGRHRDPESTIVLEELGTNSPNSNIRELTAKELARKNNLESLKILIAREGKGINDLSPEVAESTVQSLININDKSELHKILDETMKTHSNKNVKKKARSVKMLLALSN